MPNDNTDYFRGFSLKGQWSFGRYRLRKRNDSDFWYIRYTDPITKKDREKSTKRRSKRAAFEALIAFANEAELGFKEPGLGEWKKIARKMIERHRFGAKKRNLEFSITQREIERLLRENEFACCISGIKFHIGDEGFDVARNPWAPSVDRIDNRLGYVPGNVRIVCLAANIATSNWGYDILLRLANGVVRNARAKVFDDTPPPPSL